MAEAQDIKKDYWIARDSDGDLAIFNSKPRKTGIYNGSWIWVGEKGISVNLPEWWLPEIKFNNSPQPLKLKE